MITLAVGAGTGSVRTVQKAAGVFPDPSSGTVRVPVDGVVTWQSGPLKRGESQQFKAVPYTVP